MLAALAFIGNGTAMSTACRMERILPACSTPEVSLSLLIHTLPYFAQEEEGRQLELEHEAFFSQKPAETTTAPSDQSQVSSEAALESSDMKEVHKRMPCDKADEKVQ